MQHALIAISKMTVANTLRQPVTWLMTIIAMVLIALSCVFGMFNFHTADKIRLISTTGVAIHVLHGLFLAIVLSSAAIYDELMSRTALTLFAKPVSRASFLCGKILGVFITVVLSSALVIGAHYLALYLLQDAPRYEHYSHTEADGIRWLRILGAHVLALCHSLCFCAISAVLALRMNLVINIISSFALFIGGHLLGAWQWQGAVLIPALKIFNIDSSLQFADLELSAFYLVASCGYTLCFCAGCLCLGLALIKAQDIP